MSIELTIENLYLKKNDAPQTGDRAYYVHGPQKR